MEIVAGTKKTNIYKDRPNMQWGLITGIMGTEIKDVIDLSRYHSDALEYVTPSVEINGQRLVSELFRLHDEYGIGPDLWCKSKNLEEITLEATNHRALRRVYQGIDMSKEPAETREIGSTWGDYCLTYLLNSIGARNRYRRVREEFRQAIMQNPKDEFKALSVAAGSSLAMMSVMKEMKDEGRDNIHLTMVDQSPNAELDALVQANEFGIRNQVEFKRENAFMFNHYLKDKVTREIKKFGFIELVGFPDYLNDRRFVKLLTSLGQSLEVGGSILYSNIAPNFEKTFIERIVGWEKMYYRLTADLRRIGAAAGFTKIRDIKEPAGVYNLEWVTR